MVVVQSLKFHLPGESCLVARIVVCGYMIRYPVAGMMFADLHYILGLRRLGHEVFYLEESGWEKPCYNPSTGWYGDDPDVGLQAVSQLFLKYQLEDIEYSYVRRTDQHTWGTPWKEVKHRIREADLILNIAGVCWLDELMQAGRRALVDIDPLFTQTGQFGLDRIGNHNVHFSYGTNIGQPGCIIPTLGYQWHPLFPPVVPDIWAPGHDQKSEPLNERPFTTIANWQAYGAVDFQGERYGQKGEEFTRLMSLAEKTAAKLELATDNMPAEDRQRFIQAGWSVISGARVSSSAEVYSNYIKESAGEFSVAKNAYVKSNSGWFSDRSVCYLASGLPVIIQDTGVSDHIETGQGVLIFSDMEEACDCIEKVQKNPDIHRQAAQRIVEQYFDYRVVLPNMLSIALG